MMDNQESVYEGNKINDLDKDVEFMEYGLSFVQDIKFSQDYNQIIAATNQGYRIYNIPNDKTEIFEDIKIGQIYNIDFIDNLGQQVLISLENEIIILDSQLYNSNKSSPFICKSYPIICKTIELCYSNPFIIAGLENKTILIINQRTNQAYRYLKQVPYLNTDVLFSYNKCTNNTIVSYFQTNGLTAIIDSLNFQYLSGINIKNNEIEIQSEEQIIKQQQHILKQEQLTQFHNYQYYTQVFIEICQDSNRIALSPYSNNQNIYILQLFNNQPPKILYTLYRGMTKKLVSMKFGPQNIISCISFQSNINSNDATLHIYHNYQRDQKNESQIRIYFKTQTQEKYKTLRIKQTLVNFKNEYNQLYVQVFSSNNYYFTKPVEFDTQPLKPKGGISIKEEDNHHWLQKYS